MAITDTAARQAKPKDKAYTLPDSLGLSLFIAPNCVKSWHFRFTWLGKQSRISFGTYPEIGLKEARARRDEAREMIAAGVDPREARKEAQRELEDDKGKTFRKVYEEWTAFRKGKLAEGTLKGIRIAMENDVLPFVGEHQISAIKRADVISVIRRIEARGTITASVKTRQWMGQIFKYAIAIGLIETNPTAEMHVVTEKMAPYKPRAFADFSEVRNIMRAIQDSPTLLTARNAVLLMVYTVCRPGEVRFAEWSEIDLQTAIWTIPAARMKMRRDHVIPLSTQAVRVIKEMRPLSADDRYVFSGRRRNSPIGTNYATDVMAACKLQGKQSPHGFRHMFSTEMNHRGYASDWIERQLAHVDSSMIRDTYNHATYLDQRRGMMQEWADAITP